MSIREVTMPLRVTGRHHETQDSVGVDLAYLTYQGRVVRVRREVYAAGVSRKADE
jgi:hypothetical protein